MVARMGVAAALASLLGHRGLKKQSLDASGALAAFVVGFFSLASGYRFGKRCSLLSPSSISLFHHSLNLYHSLLTHVID